MGLTSKSRNSADIFQTDDPTVLIRLACFPQRPHHRIRYGISPFKIGATNANRDRFRSRQRGVSRRVLINISGIIHDGDYAWRLAVEPD